MSAFLCFSNHHPATLLCINPQNNHKQLINNNSPPVTTFAEAVIKMLGTLIAVAGVSVMAMFLLPNPIWERMIFVLCGEIVMALGLLLVKALDDKMNGRRRPSNSHSKLICLIKSHVYAKQPS